MDAAKGNSSRSILDFFFHYVASLHLDWYTYEQLFGGKPDVDKLNRRTGRVLRTFQDNLLGSILLDIAKLFDKATVTGKATASLRRAIDEMRLSPHDPNLASLNANLDTLRTLSEPIITHRHRRIAHNDRAIAIGDEVLPGVYRKSMREVIEGIGAYLGDRLRAFFVKWFLHIARS